MPQFLVTLHDGTDTGALARRQATRPSHLDGLKTNVASGKLVFGGPIFDDAQRPIGSFLLADCADRAELDAILKGTSEALVITQIRDLKQLEQVAGFTTEEKDSRFALLRWKVVQ